MPQFIAQLRRNVADSNPDYATVTIEATTKATATTALKKLIADENWKPGWFSRNEGEELWEKADGIEVLSVEPV